MLFAKTPSATPKPKKKSESSLELIAKHTVELQVARETLSKHQEKAGNAALASKEGLPGAEAEYARLKQNVQAAREAVDDAECVLKATEARHKDAMIAEQVSLEREIREQIRSNAKDVIRLAGRIRKTLDDLGSDYKRIEDIAEANHPLVAELQDSRFKFLTFLGLSEKEAKKSVDAFALKLAPQPPKNVQLKALQLHFQKLGFPWGHGRESDPGKIPTFDESIREACETLEQSLDLQGKASDCLKTRDANEIAG